MLKQPIPLESNLVIRNAVETDCDEIVRLIKVSSTVNFNRISNTYFYSGISCV
jgi:hypothetical protein